MIPHSTESSVARINRCRRRKPAIVSTRSTDNGLKRRRKAIASSDHRMNGITFECDGDRHFHQTNEGKPDQNLTALLYRREIGALHDLFDLCRTKTRSDLHSSKNTSWYSFARRIVPFSALETPPTDAVLAIDRSGSYLIALGDGRGRIHGRETTGTEVCVAPSLAIHFYAIPSPNSLIKTQRVSSRYCGYVSPHISTIPLLFDTNDHNLSTGINNAATTPVQILLSSDGKLGVVFVHQVEENEDDSGTVIIFPLPTNESVRFEKIYTVSNVHMGGLHTHSLRNLLWKTKLLPMVCPQRKNTEESTVSGTTLLGGITLKNQDGYVLFNDEVDGFRVFWIAGNSHVDSDDVANSESPAQNILSEMNDIVMPCCQSESATHSSWVDTSLGSTLSFPPSDHRNRANFNITFEAFLQIEALLREILLRRKSLVTTKDSPSFQRVPNYYYNLVSFDNCDDRSVCLVVVFANPIYDRIMAENILRKKRSPAAAYGLYVTLDLFDQSYTEGDWVSHPRNNDSQFLRQWANKLAVSKRMSDMRVGPHCVRMEKGTCKHFSGVQLHEHNIDDPLDKCSGYWSSFVNAEGDKRHRIVRTPKAVAMSSLYPLCDVITNNAVTSATPKRTIECRDFPISLTYSSIKI